MLNSWLAPPGERLRGRVDPHPEELAARVVDVRKRRVRSLNIVDRLHAPGSWWS